jgi:uncharacterized protein with gpF-like domain
MPTSAQWGSLPFDEAIKFFLKKLNLPSETWDAIWGAEHTRSFTVAGAMDQDLLQELREAVTAGINEGTTLDQFRKDFEGIVDKYDWGPAAGTPEFAWRSQVIFQTNLSVAYSAGRYQQQTDPDTLSVFPYLRYVASSSLEPRPDHMIWYNLVLPANDPWWATHYPPNDWGCKCGVVSCDDEEAAELSKQYEGTRFEVRREAPPVVMEEWTNPRTGETIQHPRGVGPGWDYNPGAAAMAEAA